MRWQPSATLASLCEGAELRHSIRQWMNQHGVLEVCTPVLSRSANTDPHVPSVATREGWYLQTSPEFAMKRLLAAHALPVADGSSVQGPQPDLYQIAPVFRAGESGRFHNSEFTLLEWYRVGMDHHALMHDVENLLTKLWESFCLPWPGIEIRRYGLEVYKRLGVWPEMASVELVQRYFERFGRSFATAIGDDRDAALDLFMDEFVLPDFSRTAFTILKDYPASQAALARLGEDEDGRVIAERFELYFGQVELANGFHELKDVVQQKQRFDLELEMRKKLGTERVPMDTYLLDALVSGLPDCAGIALGLERLQMVLGGHEHIHQILSFDDQRA